MVKKSAKITSQYQTLPLEQILAKTAALSSLPLDQILEKIVENAHDLIGTESSSILLVGNSTEVARFPSLKEERKSGPRKNGLTALVACSGEPIVIEDALGDPRVKQATKNRGVKSILGVPLKVWVEHENTAEIRTIGALFVNSVKGRQFSDRDTELLQSLAAQAAIVIESSRRAQALRTLNQISLEIPHYSQIPELVTYILIEAVKLVQAAGGRLCMLDESDEQVKWAVMSNSPDNLIPIKMEVRGGVLERVIKTRKPFAKSNYQNWSDRRKEFDKYGFSAVAGVPIVWRSKIWGAILVHHEAEGRVFSQEELNLLENLGNLAAVALENARRLDNLERLMESAFDAIIALDEVGNITKFNRQAERILGYEAKEVLGHSIRDFYYDLEEARRVRWLLIESKDGRIMGLDTFLKSKSGEKIPIRLSASLLFDYEGKRAGNVGFFRDRREYEAGQAVISSLNKNEILSSITEQAWKLTGASQSSHLALTVENRLEFIAAYPPEHLSKLQQAVGYIDLELNKPPGVMGRAAKLGQSQLVGNVHEDPDYISYDPESCSELAVPIKTQGKVIGVIDVEQSKCDAFNLQDQQTLEALAGYASIAIENARLYHQSEVHSSRLEAVARISRKAAASLEISPLLRTACRLLEQDLRGKQTIVSIRLYDEENQILVFDPSWHESFHRRINVKKQKGRRTQRLDEGICGWVARHKQPLNIGNVNDFTGYLRLIASTQAELCVPICYGENCKLMGVLDIQSPIANAFDQDDQEFLQILADQLAVAIHNAKLYEPLQRWNQHQRAIYEATRIVAAGVPVKQKELLIRILAQGVKMIKLSKGDTAILGVIQLYDEASNELYLETVYPKEALKMWLDKLGERRLLDKSKGRIGINGRTILEQKLQRVADVRLDPDYIPLDETTLSELDVPLLEGNKVLGVLSLESDQLAAFDEADEQTLQSLAELAIIAIQNARHYDELKKIKGYIGSKTAVDWIQMVSTAWGHSIQGEVGKALLRVDWLRKLLRREQLPQEVYQELEHLENGISGIQEIPITAPLSYEDGVDSVQINEVVKTYLEQWRDSAAEKSVELHLNLQEDLDKKVTVRASRAWLRRVLEIVVDNAVRAMGEVNSPVKQLLATTRLLEADSPEKIKILEGTEILSEGPLVEVSIIDTGPGIPKHIKEKLFKEPIAKPVGSTGAGIGLMLAQTIIQTYQGNILVGDTERKGTNITVVLPIED